MSHIVKSILIEILLAVSLHTSAKAQREFIDSVGIMLADLNLQIQYAPINQLLQSTISYCTGDSMNDPLEAGLKQLLSEDYIFRRGILQQVPPNLLQKYAALIQRITNYFLQNGTAAEYKKNMLGIVIATLRIPALQQAGSFERLREILLGLQLTEPFKSMFYLGEVYENLYKPDSAYFFYEHSLLQNPNNQPGEKLLYGKTLFYFAECCRVNHRPDTAFLLFQQAMAVHKQIYGDKNPGYAYWLLETANRYIYMAKYDLALELDFKVLEITKNSLGEYTNQYAVCLNEIGEIYFNTGEYEKALPFTQKALAIKRRIFGNDYFDNVVSLHDLATLYMRIGLNNEAISYLYESLEISKKYFGESSVYASDLHPLAEAYENLGEYDKALPLYNQAVQILKRMNDTTFYYCRTLHSLACLYTKLGQYNKAIELFKRTLSIKKKVFGEINPQYTKTLNRYAEAYLLKGDYKKALALQQQSLAVNKKLFGDIHPSIAEGYYNLSALYYQQDDLKKAEEFCNRSLQLQKQVFGNIHPDIATGYDMLGNISNKKQAYKSALGYYSTAFEIRRAIMASTHPAYINSLSYLGLTYTKEGLVTKGAQLLMQADSLALLHIEQSYGSLSEEEKLIYLHNREKQFQYLPSLLYLRKINNPQIVLRTYSDAIALKSMILFHQEQIYNSIRRNGDSLALQLYNSWRFNKAFLGKQILMPPEQRISDFDSLQDITLRMEEQLSNISLPFRNNALHIEGGIKSIADHLSKDEAAVEFIRFRLYNNNFTDSIIYAALVLLPDSNTIKFIPLFEETQLGKLMQYSNNRGEAAVNYLYPSAGRETEVSDKLYRLIWQPLESLLDSVHTVYYSPCGLLYRIPFAALHLGNKKLLVDKYTLKQLLSTRSLSWPVEKENLFSNASIWGNIDYDKAATLNQIPVNGNARVNSFLFGQADKNHFRNYWESLPETKREAESISFLLKEKNISCKLQTEQSATEEQFKEMDGHAPGLLHIATHGFFLPATNNAKTDPYFQPGNNTFYVQQDPMFRSGLLLSGSNTAWSGNKTTSGEDGVLTAYEIAQLDFSNTQLVTLSACETALGEIEDYEGVYGLQRAFKMAGAKQVLMSLWKVPDKETTQLMQLFYTSLLQGDKKSTALRKAQLAMKKQYTPYYWAGFILSE